ncbi:hypothetical protein ACFV16_22355 [Streptomyces massasporeus]|uniref:hypothetical protein n=1 Tax=Streptomyces massasporeus TaxID=67324 RepID=UPI003680E8B7
MSPQTVSPEDYALNALNAITREDTEAARQHIAGLGFKGRALLAAWAEELTRLTRDEQSHYELLERRTTRERREAEESAERSREALRAGIAWAHEDSGADAPTVNASDFADLGRSRSWIVGELARLTDEGVLKPVSDYPGRYFILKSPGEGGTRP